MGDGQFTDDERDYYLDEARSAIWKAMLFSLPTKSSNCATPCRANSGRRSGWMKKTGSEHQSEVCFAAASSLMGTNFSS